jgi:hypothetical protein
MNRRDLVRKWSVSAALGVCLAAGAREARGWGECTHAFVARKALRLEGSFAASYYAGMGSSFPDFFLYAQDAGLATPEQALWLHGVTEEPEVTSATTYLYDLLWAAFGGWHYRMRFFAEGVRTHVYADVAAHNVEDGYIEGTNGWVELLAEMTGETNRLALHTALEFAVDAMVVHEYGPQFGDVWLDYAPAPFLDRREYRDYLSTVESMEAGAALYYPCLTGKKADSAFVRNVRATNWGGGGVPDMSAESLDAYSNTLRILLTYPAQIYDTITRRGMHWQKDALPAVIDFCQ